MAQQDMAAIAAKYGGVPVAPTQDVAALAQKYGGVPVQAEMPAREPNTLGTVVSHVGAQINPLTLIQTVGQALAHPIDTTKAIGAAQGALYDKAKAAYEHGDYLTASRHFINYLLPLVGPGLDKSSDLFNEGQWAAGTGDAVGLGLAMFGPKALQNVAGARYPLAVSHPAARRPAVSTAKPEIQFAQERGVPLDAATVSDNLAVKGAQALSDRSLGGAAVATPARAVQAEAMARVGRELADQARAGAATMEEAGTAVRDALSTKIAGHVKAANTAYDRLRDLETSGGLSLERSYTGKGYVAYRPDSAWKSGKQYMGNFDTLDAAQRFAATQVRTQVSLAPVKESLVPIYDQMKRQMPLTQQQANPGLKAIENIVNGPDFAPLSQIDRDLSAIKTVAREQGGIAKVAVRQLDTAVQRAASAGGPEVVAALKQGRAATIAKYAATDVLERLNTEPVRTVTALTAPKDSAIQSLRAVLKEVPDQAPIIARGYLEQLLDKPNKVAEWRKLGSQTRHALFPKAGQVAALDQFMALTERISKTNVNPSGSGYMAALGAQGAMFWYDPIHAAMLQVSTAGLSKLLRAPATINLLTRGLSLPNTAPLAARTAATAALIRSAKEAGVALESVPAALPKAAEQQPAETRP